jgi:hypothetical protein
VVASIDKLAPLRRGDGAVEFVASLDESDFERARAVIPDGLNADYQDWLDDRYGLTVGLCAGGVEARMVSVSLCAFLTWRQFANGSTSQTSLDDFAALVSAMAHRRAGDLDIAIFAQVSAAEFAEHFEAVEAFQRARDYPTWQARRKAALRAVADAGNVALTSPTPIGRFLDWGRCVDAGSSEALLDRYASLMIEALASEHYDPYAES